MVSARTGTQLGAFLNGSEEHYNFAALRIHRGQVQKTLLREARNQGIDVHFNKKLLQIRQETDDGVVLEFEGGELQEADYVIGADGVWSRVRKHVVDVELPYSGFVGILGMNMPQKALDASLQKFHLPMFCFGDTGMIAVFPTNFTGTQFDIFSTFPYPARSREEWEKLSENKEEKQEIMMRKFSSGGWPKFIDRIYKEHVPEKLHMHVFFEVPPLARWSSSKGRVILMGDAAHAFSPQGGQGAAMSFEDAETLAMTMSRPDFDANRQRLLGAWQAHRQERVRQVKAYTDNNGRLRTPTDSWFKRVLKDWVMWAILSYKGPLNGMQWLFGYDGENIVKVLRQ